MFITVSELTSVFYKHVLYMEVKYRKFKRTENSNTWEQGSQHNRLDEEANKGRTRKLNLSQACTGIINKQYSTRLK